ncbi:MAG: ATP-binding cassette domain-containing protein, partial [Propionibacteriaceae bacterium]|nr:ATP-binding cassette domain-containing protein [Propionibacteriaceae bacterium]
MLQLDGVRKTYSAGGFEQAALDGVSISFRDNEFVAILGPSGSGKTTLLNIVGGLDHYDSGTLSIDEISTEAYSDRDWDTYRNNRIGFVFQSYNLIPHQSVLANVELALTLSGVARAERVQRAKAALEQVGLSEHLHKLPNQLSGGQMQRVAIARALINDPEILLADEPTGALDSATGVTVMNLLREIARERLVIMVTHNPDLASEYANRIVSLSDGKIVADTHPYDAPREQREAKTTRRTSMGFLTAIALSFTNLMTKKGRTLMTSFAGSIGIIGIATILALANGVNAYISKVEEETLSQYPLSIQSQGIDLTAMLAIGSGTGAGNSDGDTADNPDRAHEVKMVASMFGQVGKNDLGSLKSYLESPESGMSSWVNSIEYSYPLTPQIYSPDTSAGINQVNPNRAFSPLGISSEASGNSLISMGMSADIFSPLPANLDLVVNQYDIQRGHWPQSADECVMVLMPTGGIPDFMLYAMGLRDSAELQAMVEQIANNEEVTPPKDKLQVTFEQLMEVNFKLVQAADYYQWDPEYQVWTDRRSDDAYMKKLIADGRTLKIAGVVRPNPDASASTLGAGIYYSADLPFDLISRANDSPIIKEQLANPGTNVFTGNSFADDAANPDASSFNFADFLKIDQEALEQAFTSNLSGLDFSKLALDFDPSGIDLTGMSAPSSQPPDLASLLANLDLKVDSPALVSIMGGLIGDYLQEVYGPGSQNWPESWPTALPTALPSTLPTALPTTLPSVLPTELPSVLPTALPSSLPTELPSTLPTAFPSSLPTSLPTVLPIDPANPDQMPAIPTPAEIADGFANYLNRPKVQAKLFSELAGVIDIKTLESQVGKALADYLTSMM